LLGRFEVILVLCGHFLKYSEEHPGELELSLNSNLLSKKLLTEDFQAVSAAMQTCEHLYANHSCL